MEPRAAVCACAPVHHKAKHLCCRLKRRAFIVWKEKGCVSFVTGEYFALDAAPQAPAVEPSFTLPPNDSGDLEGMCGCVDVDGMSEAMATGLQGEWMGYGWGACPPHPPFGGWRRNATCFGRYFDGFDRVCGLKREMEEWSELPKI